MLKQSSVLKAKATAAITMAILLSASSYAEYPDTTLSTALRSATAGISGERKSDANTGFREELDKEFKELQKKFDESKEESEKRARNEKWAKKRNAALNKITETDRAKLDILAERKKKNDTALESIKQMPTGLNANPSTFNTSQYTGECAVDMSAAEQFVQKGLSPEQAQLKQLLSKKLEDSQKEQTLKLLEAEKAARSHLKEKKAEQARLAQQPPQPLGPQFAIPNKDQIGSADLSLQNRLARLESDGAILKQQMDDAEKQKEDIQDKFLDFIEKTLTSDSTFQSDLIGFADALEKQRQMVYNSAVSGAESAFKACSAKADQLGREGLDSPNTNLNTAKKWVQKFYSGPANAKKRSEFTNELNQLAQNVACVDRAPSIKNLLGQNLKSQIDQLRVVTDPSVARQVVTGLMDGFSNAIGQVDPLLHGTRSGGQISQPGVLSACELVQAKDKRVRQIVTSIKGQSDQSVGSVADTGPRNRRGGRGAGAPVGQGAQHI